MFDHSQDVEEYTRVWQSILRNVLQYTDAQVQQWMSERGNELLANPSIVFHEEPWFWLCGETVHVCSVGQDAVNFRESENGIFHVFSGVFATKKLDDVDWEEVRLECKDAIQTEAQPTSKSFATKLEESIVDDPFFDELVQNWPNLGETVKQIIVELAKHEAGRAASTSVEEV